MKRFIPFLLAATLLFVFGLVFQAPQGTVAAPRAAITPVAIEDPVAGDTALITFYDNVALEADDQKCIDLMGYRVIDLEYVVDQGETNTTTVTLEHTNGAGAALTTNTTGQTVANANAADADDLNRYDLFGRYTCVDVNVTNSEAITWTIIGVARK